MFGSGIAALITSNEEMVSWEWLSHFKKLVY